MQIIYLIYFDFCQVILLLLVYTHVFPLNTLYMEIRGLKLNG